MAKVRALSDEELVKSLYTKLKEADEKQESLRLEWEICKFAYQCISGGPSAGRDAGQAEQSFISFSSGEEEYKMPLIEGLDTAKAVLFLHSKLCISDPTLSVSPRKLDQQNKNASEYAQSFLPYIRERTHLQEKTEAGSYLATCVYGSGITYFGWDKDGGDFPKSGAKIPDGLKEGEELEFDMEGDYDLRDVSPYCFWIDATAKHWIDANHCFEKAILPIEQALFEYSEPEQQDILRQYVSSSESMTSGSGGNTADAGKTRATVDIYHFWERGRPWNGFIGSHVIFVNPKEPKVLYRGPNPYKHKQLPYSIMTDVDIPDSPWGMSRIMYAFQVQLSINNLITLIMDNTSLFGGNKLLAPSGAVNEEAMDNSRDTVAFYDPSSGGKIEHIRPGNVTSDVWKAYDIMKLYINNIYGMNEFSQGQIPRELSSYAVQLALEMDDKYRIRLFNKKKNYLRDIYRFGLSYAQQFMDDGRQIAITGVEGQADAPYFQAAKLEGDYDVMVDYGPYLPVDPSARKQQLLEFVKSGFYEKAGGNMKKVAALLVDGTMLDVRQNLDAQRKRQFAEIDRIIKGEEVNIQPWDRHEDHAAAVEEYTDSEAFNSLDIQLKKRIWEHGEKHVEAAAKKIAESQPQQPPGAGAPPPQGGMPPPPPGAGAGAPPPGSSPDAAMGGVNQPSGPIV